MKEEHPIIFSAPMVRAILDGKKTQTRRLIKDRRHPWIEHDYWPGGETDYHPLEPYEGFWPVYNTEDGPWPLECPYGIPGDRLWVREKFAVAACYDGVPPSAISLTRNNIEYGTNPGYLGSVRGKWRPSIHMPRWASRITLEVTDIRVERLQEISFDDCYAEGVETYIGTDRKTKINVHMSPFQTFANSWESIHGPGAWEKNPWVWVVSFRKDPSQ